MKIRLQVSDLKDALDVVSIVPPRPVTPQGGSGYLFVVKGGQCSIYSRDAQHQSKADVQLIESDGEGSFVYPADRIGSLRYLDGTIQIEAGHDEKDDRYWVRYEAEGGASAERSSIDPRFMQSLDEALEKASEGYPFSAAVLREGINVTKPYLLKLTEKDDLEHFKTLQLFDPSKKEWANGDGCLFAADTVSACYFHCETFKGKGLSVPGQHLPYLVSFLSKCEGDVTIRHGEGVTYAVNSKGHVLGWSGHVKQHGKYSYYPLKSDTFILRVPKDILVKALRHVNSELEAKRTKIRVQYTFADKFLRFQASGGTGKASSVPVGVVPVRDGEAGDRGESADFACNVDVERFLDILEPMKSHEVDLRVAIFASKEGRKEQALLRTIEKFKITDSGKVVISESDSKDRTSECQVTRFMTSMT